MDALTRAERTRLLDALKTWEPHDGNTLPKGTHWRFYTVMHYTLLRRGEAWAIHAGLDRLEGQADPHPGRAQQERRGRGDPTAPQGGAGAQAADRRPELP